MNAGKAALYKTALFHRETVANRGDLPTAPVRVKFIGEEWNETFKRPENVYACYATMDDASLLGEFYEHALTSFVL